MRADQDVFHFLLEHHAEIRRSVERLPKGVSTRTESDNPQVAAKIQEHVAAMKRRVESGSGLRFWDDLFVAIFKNYARIQMKVENIDQGVRVIETSEDAWVVALIQAHADVVSRFVKYGFDEAHRNHAVPVTAASAASKLEFPVIADFGGVVPRREAAEPPRAGTKVVLDVTADADPAAVNKGLDRAARLLNLYGAAGLQAGDIRLTLVLHGEATKSVLNDDAYRRRFDVDTNPNLPLVRALRSAGVEVFVCGQALHYKQFPAEEVANEVPIAVAALTVVINRQADGFGYVPVP